MNLRNINTFDERLSQYFRLIRNVETLLEVDFPLVFSFEADDNKSYLAYVLNFKRRKKILEMLVVETNYQILHDLSSQRVSLKQALIAPTQKYITNDGLVETLPQDYLEQLPDDDFYLTELLPNRVDISVIHKRFADKLKSQNEISSKIQHSDEIQEFKYVNYVDPKYFFKIFQHNSKIQRSELLKEFTCDNLIIDTKVKKKMYQDTQLCGEYYDSIQNYYATTPISSETVGIEVKTNRMVNPRNAIKYSNWEKNEEICIIKEKSLV